MSNSFKISYMPTSVDRVVGNYDLVYPTDSPQILVSVKHRHQMFIT